METQSQHGGSPAQHSEPSSRYKHVFRWPCLTAGFTREQGRMDRNPGAPWSALLAAELRILCSVMKVASRDKQLYWEDCVFKDTMAVHIQGAVTRDVNRAGARSFSRLLLPDLLDLRDSVYRFEDLSNEVQCFGSGNELPARRTPASDCGHC